MISLIEQQKKNITLGTKTTIIILLILKRIYDVHISFDNYNATNVSTANILLNKIMIFFLKENENI